MDDLTAADPVAVRAERQRRADHDGRPARIADLHESIARAIATGEPILTNEETP